MEGITLMAKHEKTPEELFAEQFVKQLQPKTVEDVENGLKSIFGPIFESMLQGELTAHLGYDSNNHQPKRDVIFQATMVVALRNTNKSSWNMRSTF